MRATLAFNGLTSDILSLTSQKKLTNLKISYEDSLELKKKIKKSHTCEECGGTPQNFCMSFIDELENQLLKNLLKWVYKNVRIFIFTMLHFLKKIKTPGISLFYTCVPRMISSTVPETQSVKDLNL